MIPTLDAADHVPLVLDALAPAREFGLLRDVIVVDGGSADGTVSLARARGARVLQA
ncbi:MAG: glycosyl transferase, partial [Alphaproteobacteria bacterium]|nr:glycosyl transferase [Alphaproteobacteria bacterium]